MLPGNCHRYSIWVTFQVILLFLIKASQDYEPDLLKSNLIN